MAYVGAHVVQLRSCSSAAHLEASSGIKSQRTHLNLSSLPHKHGAHLSQARYATHERESSRAQGCNALVNVKISPA